MSDTNSSLVPPTPPTPPPTPTPPPVPVPPPTPPPVSPPPAPSGISHVGGSPQAANDPFPPVKKRKLPILLFVIIGLVVILGIALVSGQLTRFVPRLGGVTLTYWGLWEPESIIRPILDEFEQSHSGIKVNYVMQSPQEYRERLQAALDKNAGPDLFRIHNTWTAMMTNYLAPVPPTAISSSDYEKTFYPIVLKDFKVGGNYAAIPLGYDGIAMYINDDLLQKSRLSVPQNWVELTDAALAMSQCASPDGSCKDGSKIVVSGVALGSTNVDHWQDILAVIMLQNNVNLDNPASPNPAPAEDVIEFFKSFVRTFHVWDPNLPSSTEYFASGKVGIYFAPSWRVFDIQAINPNLRFSIYPLPQLPVDPSRGEKPITYSSYWGEAVSNKSQFQKEAWELLKYLSSAEVMQKTFQLATSPQRAFGEPYSRVDLAESLKDNKYLDVYLKQAPLAASWYLASFTHDGQTGINTKMSEVFAKAITGTATITSLAPEINKVLSEYGIFTPQVQPQ